MNQCTLYVSIADYQKIVDAIKETFPDKEVQAAADGQSVTVTDKKWFGKSTLAFNFMREEADPERFLQMKKGMYGFLPRLRRRMKRSRKSC